MTNSDNCGNIYNVGCMKPYMDYTPRTLDEIIVGAGLENPALVMLDAIARMTREAL